MLRKVEVRNFKMFEEQTFDLPDHLVVVGPNNGGKTSLLQAIATWSEVANHWFETNPDFARRDDGNYPAADLNLRLFDAVPLADFPHLWRRKQVIAPISISVETEDWRVGFAIEYSATELAGVRPMRDVPETNLERCKERPPTIVHVPPSSGLLVEERPLTEDGVRASVRSGKIADVLRNVLVFVAKDASKWKQLQRVVREFFGYELLPPSAGARVVALYRHRPTGEAYDLSSAASGFLQVLASYAALLFEEASVILIDEPDAHLHLLLQEMAYRKLLRFASQANSQLVIATHSEVIIKEADQEHLRMLWSGFRQLAKGERIDDVLRLENEVLMLAETEPGILYVEGDSDIPNLREWAQVTGHPVFRFLDKPFWQSTASSRSKDYAAKHFRALRKMVPHLNGVELRDGDVPKPQRSPTGLLRLRWRNKEIESYLLHPQALARFVRQERGDAVAAGVWRYMKRQLPPGLFDAPFDANLIAEGSVVLDNIMQEAGLPLKKTDYWRIAAQMRAEEVHPEVLEKLDAIAAHFDIGTDVSHVAVQGRGGRAERGAGVHAGGGRR